MGGGTAFREGLDEGWVGWVCSFCSFCQLPGERDRYLSHTHSSLTSSHLYLNPTTSPQSLPTPSHCHSACFLQGLTMNQRRKSLERKASLCRYLAALPHPACGHPEKGQCGLSLGEQGLPSGGQASGSLNAGVHQSICFMPGAQGEQHSQSAWPRSPTGPKRPARTPHLAGSGFHRGVWGVWRKN